MIRDITDKVLEKPEDIDWINRSIARLVFTLNCWGVKTVESHAGFYPGDPEEQEYWSIKEISAEKLSGPLVLMGSNYDPAYVIFKASLAQAKQLESLLTPGWSLKQSREEYYKLVYTKLMYFNDAVNKFWMNKFPEFWFGEDNEENDPFEDLSAQDISELNLNIPLTPEEYNRIRDSGIAEQTKVLHDDIFMHPIADIKKRVELLLGLRE